MSNHKSEEERHDRSQCSVCKRWFWGVASFDTHRPCGQTGMRGKYVILDELYVLKGDAALYRKTREHMKKVRAGRRNGR